LQQSKYELLLAVWIPSLVKAHIDTQLENTFGVLGQLSVSVPFLTASKRKKGISIISKITVDSVVM